MSLVQFSQKSQTSLQEVGQQFATQFAKLTANKAFEIAHQFFAFGEALADTPALPRALTNLAATSEAKATLIKDLTKSIKADKLVVDILTALTDKDWSKPTDLFAICCEFGFNSMMISLSKREDGKKELERIEAELFKMIRTIKDTSEADEQMRELNDYLSSPSSPMNARFEILNVLFAKKIDSATLLLAKSATMAVSDGQHFVDVLQIISDEIASARGRKVVHICSAVPMSTAQQKRLEQLLVVRLNKEIQLNIVVDPSLLGGIRIRVDGTIFDSTLAKQVNEFEQQLMHEV
jgi:F-type H+-transporting ATPase subunit delta